MPALNKCYNISDLRKRAKSKLPAPMFHYIDGGSDDEWTLTNNTTAFERYEFNPSYLRNIENINLKKKIMGVELDLPFFLAPTGMSRLFHHHKEPAVARAAHRFGTLYSLSTLGTTSIEDVAATTPGPKMFQIYIHKDRGLTSEFVRRCKEAGYTSMCLTVDTMVAGNRERDLYNGMVMPPKVTTLSNFLSYATSFQWWFNMLKDPDFKLANVSHRQDALGAGSMGLIEYLNSQFDRAVTWDDAAKLIEEWGGPFLIKGLQSVEDAKQAVDIGASGIMISNHGGRQLEAAPAPVDCLQPIRDAVGDKLELIVDGGIRRATHIIKALALGADACSIGRAYLYGLAAGGEQGVNRAIGLLKAELERTMALLGVNDVNLLNTSHIIHQASRSAQTYR